MMAEFMQVAREKRRMCNSYQQCIECPFADDTTACLALPVNSRRDDIMMKVESTVMSWAAEHSEQVYPTWLEFVKRFETGGPKSDVNFIIWMRTTSIPADIAEKLGLQPKEGV